MNYIFGVRLARVIKANRKWIVPAAKWTVIKRLAVIKYLNIFTGSLSAESQSEALAYC